MSRASSIIRLLFLFFFLVSGVAPQLVAGERGALTLREADLLKLIRRNSDRLAQSRSQEDLARASLDLEMAQFLPRISLDAYYNRYKDHPFIDFESNRGVALRLSQLLFSGGEVENAIRQAKAVLKASRWSRQEVEAFLLYQARFFFYQCLFAEELVRIRKELLDLAEETLRVTEERFSQGLAPEYDLLRSKVAVSEARSDLRQARAVLEDSYTRLKLALGLSPEVEVRLRGDLPEEPKGLSPETLFRDYALAHRPAILSARERWRAGEYGVKSAFGRSMPKVYLEFEDHIDDRQAFARGRPEYDDYMLTWLKVSLSLDFFLNRARYNLAKASLKKARAGFSRVKKEVLAGVHEALVDLYSALDRVKMHRDAVCEAERAYRIALDRYAAGESSHLDVLSSRTSLGNARVALAEARCEMAQAMARLEYEIGGSIDEVKGEMNGDAK